mmetsp:Transcript_15263/g.16988  ORF Transcript_15263/g.16988 Transcript_15263/m.16988 type:complete len:110 (+) Transcript_15263:473-802(+)
MENPQNKIKNDVKLINYISSNSNQIFTPKVRLFNPGFLKLDDVDYEHEDKISQARDDLKIHLETVRKDFKEMDSKFEKQLSQNTTDEEFDIFEKTLKDTRERVIEFKQE